MSDATQKLSDAEVFQILNEAQEAYEQYLKLPDIPETPQQAMPAYSWSNPIGLVVNAVVD